MSYFLKGNRRLARTLQAMEDNQRITSPAARRTVRRAWKIARRRGYGFRDRTGLLRRSLRIEQARDRKGRFETGWQLVASTRYAAFVEFRRRTRDRRPGPPYWLGRAFAQVRKRMPRDLADEVRRNVESAVRR